jgi:AcrR family transcriptional regulator
MPVDHDERRRRIAEAAAAVTAREGLDAATIRRIAAELGGPTKLVTYYFADKQALLLFTYGHLAQQYLEEVAALDPGDLVGNLMAMAAAGERSLTRWRFYVAFWDRAARNPAFAELQRLHMDRAVAHIREIVRAAAGDRADVESVSLVLNALVQGISLQALADPQRWPAERIRSALSDQIDRLLGQRQTEPQAAS